MAMKTKRRPSGKLTRQLQASFQRLGVVLTPSRRVVDRDAIINPACARLPDGSLQLYPRMVAPGNISRIGSYCARERGTKRLVVDQEGFALEPHAPYELRDKHDGHGCEDPRVTYVPILDRYLMTYVAFGPQGPEVAVASSADGLAWDRHGLMHFKQRGKSFADKDAAFFPEPVRSPSGVESLAMFHRPMNWALWAKHGPAAARLLKTRMEREGIAIAYITLDAVRRDIRKICNVAETRALKLNTVRWGKVKVGAGTPPVRIREGWLSIIHGVDEIRRTNGKTRLRYSAGILVLSTSNVQKVVYRSTKPLFAPELPLERDGRVGEVVFPTAIDPRPDLGAGVYDIYYGMGDKAIGRGRLTLAP